MARLQNKERYHCIARCVEHGPKMSVSKGRPAVHDQACGRCHSFLYWPDIVHASSKSVSAADMRRAKQRHALQVVWALLTLPPTGHKLQDVAPDMLLYRRRPSAEVPSHLPQAKSPPPALAVPVQFRCRQQVIVSHHNVDMLQSAQAERKAGMQPVRSYMSGFECHLNVCAT